MNVPSFVIGFLLGNIINFIELGVILKVSRDISEMLRQFKDEGSKGEWLK